MHPCELEEKGKRELHHSQSPLGTIYPPAFFPTTKQ